ncbi:hypothetical protein BAE44_0015916 [Dichanthelium oligosanthes]|uniref:Uncharacterized protein n=1 Tax=Dichanthelium oligosanthes TaxID=888268 RepID=A0A1E5VDE7_9POAL|nr:hypothetical protein BAE44_0015916 [Dichanthelium oligosanthes]
MAASARNIACFALLVSIVSLKVPSPINQRCTSAGTTTTAGVASASAQPPHFDDGALQAVLALAGMEALFIAAAIVYSHHLHHAAAVGANNWSISELVFFILCQQAGFLQFLLFVQQPADGGGADDEAHALGISAAHALPGVASVTFFLGIFLVYAPHVGSGGGGAGGAIAAGVRFHAYVTLAAALVCLTTIVLAFYANTK